MYADQEHSLLYKRDPADKFYTFSAEDKGVGERELCVCVCVEGGCPVNPRSAINPNFLLASPSFAHPLSLATVFPLTAIMYWPTD